MFKIASLRYLIISVVVYNDYLKNLINCCFYELSGLALLKCPLCGIGIFALDNGQTQS